MPTLPDCRRSVYRLIHEAAPRSLLWLGPEPPELSPPPETLVHLRTAQALPKLGRFELAVLEASLLAQLEGQSGPSVIARLRDLHGGRFVVGVAAADRERWSDRALYALGLTRLTECGEGQVLFGFDIASYKTTPDWLNPKFWAHPERWGQDWW